MQSEQERLRERLQACDKALRRLHAHGDPASLNLAWHIKRTRQITLERLTEPGSRLMLK